jgi:hypothetical protein
MPKEKAEAAIESAVEVKSEDESVLPVSVSWCWPREVKACTAWEAKVGRC